MEVKMKKIFKEEESIEISKILGLIANIEEYQRIYNQLCRYFLQNLDWKKWIKQEII